MSIALDWKFAVTFLATVAGVVVPIALWQADLSSKTLSLEVVSVTSLDPSTPQQVHGLAVALDGAPVSKPFLSVLQVRNTGSRPVVASEFESPVEIVLAPPAKLLRVEVTNAEPPDLKPSVSVSDAKLLIQPLLLNPRDSLQLNVLTANAQPSFSARSRIAGVASIPTLTSTSSKSSRRTWLQEAMGVVLLSVYLVQMVQALEAYRRRSVVQLWTACTAIASAFGGILLLNTVGGSAEVTSTFKAFLIHAAPAVPLGLLLAAIRARLQSAA